MAFDGGADWLSYSLQDFVMFGPQVFLRLFVRINQDLWPWPVLAVVLAIAIPCLLAHRRLLLRRLGLLLVSCAWITSGFGFLIGYFGLINWPATWFGWAFIGQGMLLAIGVMAKQIPRASVAMTGLWLALVVCLPWLTVALAGEWRALALFGVAPDTTVAVAILASALFAGAWRWLYLVLPVLWALFSAATFWGLQVKALLVFPVATLLLAIATAWLSPSQGQSRG